MLFNSYFYLLGFLPLVVVLVSFAAKAHGARMGIIAVASVLFYGFWDVSYVPLLLGSVLANFLLGLGMARWSRHQRSLLWLGLWLNLLTLGIFKYLHFFSEVSADLFGTGVVVAWLLPLAISFFTFQQISYLVDVSRKTVAAERSLLRYFCFVAFFPQLIAGPIVRAKELLPQLPGTMSWDHAAKGLVFITMGLAKKVILAQNLSIDELIRYAETGKTLSVADSSLGALVYGLHIYFDFSAYTDMALGSALLLGIVLPLNFNSPYKATSIVDFWRRWHMTLSAFLRDYLYVPLGGNRRGGLPRLRNVLIVMLLGGLWHGADWGFVVWGGLHAVGIGLCYLYTKYAPVGLPKPLAIGVTFSFVTLAWMPFFCEDWGTLMTYLKGFTDWDGLRYLKVDDGLLYWAGAALLLVFGAPNSQEIVNGSPSKRKFLSLQYNWLWAGGIAVLLLTSLIFLYSTERFLYFQF